MIVTNHQPQFLPYLGFFHKVANADVLVLLDDVQFMDRHFQQRNVIKMQTGSLLLTVPVAKQRFQLIQHVQIAPVHNWRRKMWSTIQTSYGAAPHFKALAPELRAIILEGAHTHLLALDIDLMQWAFRVLGITVPIRLSSELGLPKTNGPNEHHIAICRAVGADTYLSGPGGREYMDLALFEQAKIAVQFQSYTMKPYPQQFPQHGFIPNLAVVDALFNVGADARELIR